MPALLNPQSPEHFKMNVIYTVLVAISSFLIYLSHKDPKHTPLIREAACIFVARNMIRCLDLEHTKEKMGEGEWAFLVTQQTSLMIIDSWSIFRCFDCSSWYTLFLGFLSLEFCIIFGFIGQIGNPLERIETIPSSVVYLILINIVVVIGIKSNDIQGEYLV
jgi:hypothetical protein